MKLYFIGAGPGDPELLTLKAEKIIRSADIIIFAGSLVNPKLLKLAKKAVIYDSSRMTLEEVVQVIRRAKTTGKLIARIHSGDPSLYGAIQEQMAWCDLENISYEVVPGVSSFCAGAASLKQELTLPDISQTVILTRLSGKTKVPTKENLRRLAKIRATLIVFLSVEKINKVVKQLRAGYPRDTPVAIVFRASWPDEKIVKGTLENIAEKLHGQGIDKQALIYVGDVLKREGYKKSRLYDKHFAHGCRKKSQ